MLTIGLGEFITVNREEVIRRCKAKVAQRSGFVANPGEIEKGIPLFLGQLIGQLAHETPNTRAIRSTATEHGHNLFLEGLTIGQVVHDYGDVCQSVTELAGELGAPVSPDDFRTLNSCLDDAIASAVSEFALQERAVSDRQLLGQSASLKNLLFTAITAFEALQTGTVGITGNTGSLLHRSLLAMAELM